MNICTYSSLTTLQYPFFAQFLLDPWSAIGLAAPTTAADLPLWSQFRTASRLKVSSNFRCTRTDVGFTEIMLHLCFIIHRFSVRQFEATSIEPRNEHHKKADPALVKLEISELNRVGNIAAFNYLTKTSRENGAGQSVAGSQEPLKTESDKNI